MAYLKSLSISNMLIFFPGTSVLQVTASDADDPTYGNSARIVYSILQGQPYFSVDPKTGVLHWQHWQTHKYTKCQLKQE